MSEQVQKHHDLKLKRLYFEDKLAGLKPWEIRKNDRDYQVGDTVTFREVMCGPTGRTLGPVVITYVLLGGRELELAPDGVCIFTHTCCACGVIHG